MLRIKVFHNDCAFFSHLISSTLKLDAAYINVRISVFYSSLKISLILCMSNYITLHQSKKPNSQCEETAKT